MSVQDKQTTTTTSLSARDKLMSAVAVRPRNQRLFYTSGVDIMTPTVSESHHL